jgi:hypothetical protein
MTIVVEIDSKRRRAMPTLPRRWSAIVCTLTCIGTIAIAGGEPSTVFRSSGQAEESSSINHDYRVLATKKTSTMEKELNEAGGAGYRFAAVMGGGTGFGGSEVVVVMVRRTDAPSDARYEYKLLATSKTSTMQKELQEASDAGFEYRGQTVFSSTFGGQEVVLIGEREDGATPKMREFKLLATSKTSTMQKELQEAAEGGFEVVGLTVASTSFGGSELVTVLRRERAP